jgi:septal ring factor EnvC (AmiA/AmiB activator)
LSKDLTELEQRQADEQEQKRKTDQQLASLKNEEASLRLDLEEILAVHL